MVVVGSTNSLLFAGIVEQNKDDAMFERSMTPMTLSAYTLVTANGRGIGAVSQALRERRSGLKPCDFEDALLKTYIGRVAGLEDFSLGHHLERFDCRNNRLAWLGLQQDGFMVAVDRKRTHL